MTVDEAWKLADVSGRANAIDKSKEPKSWKVFLYACHFFVSYSRLFTFLTVLLRDVTALGIVFFPGRIMHFIQLVIIADLFRGLFLFGYFLVLLETFFFPDEISGMRRNDIEMTENPIVTTHRDTDGPPRIIAEKSRADDNNTTTADGGSILHQTSTDTGYNTLTCYYYCLSFFDHLIFLNLFLEIILAL
jgi:hypothetical protein